MIICMNYQKESIKLHKQIGGKLEVSSRVKVKNKQQLSLAYSPGVAGPCLEIQKDESQYRNLVSAGKTVAIISDGSAVLGLGNLGAKAAMPVMEGKSVLMREFAGLNSIPIVLDTQDTEEIIAAVKAIAPSFAAINLEDISAPRCFEIEERLKQELSIPVFHDDQHGTAIVVLAGLINALKVTGRKKKEEVRIVVNGAGAAGVAIVKLLVEYGFTQVVVCDSKGILYKKRTDLNDTKKALLKLTNKQNMSGALIDAMNESDVFIGVSKANLLSKEHIWAMREEPIVFGLANPDPEISAEHAKEYGVAVLATGRSDYPNQINNVLAFPGIFKGAINSKAANITEDMKLAAAVALAKMVKKPTAKKIVPGPFEKGVADIVAKQVAKFAKKSK